MDISKKMYQLNQSEALWKKNQRLLLAISGGVDSMVMLRLFEDLPGKQRPFFAVAHVDHQLRPSSKEEAEFLARYCRERGIPFHFYRWENNASQTGNLEARAREMRYNFFAEVCQTYSYSGVVTGHHSNDQAETFLLKLIRGTQLKDLVSIQTVSKRDNLIIYRPLLDIPKANLLEFANKHDLTYFEDETNQTLVHQRNRVRHEIIPRLEAENDNFLQHIHSLVRQIEYANHIMAEIMEPLLEIIVKEVKPNTWRFDLSQFNKIEASHQYMLLVTFFQKALIEARVPLQEQHLQDSLALLISDKAYGVITLPHNWEMAKNYEWAYLRQQEVASPEEERFPKKFELMPGQSVFVSKTEWFGLEKLDEPLEIPTDLFHWERHELLLTEPLSDFPLQIRHGNKNERIMLNQAGQSKELRRVLIDAKVPRDLRQNIWLVANSSDLLWFVPIRKSYLSIRKETDKIHYRLIYLKDKLDLGGDFYVRERY